MNANGPRLHAIEVRWQFLATAAVVPAEIKAEPSRTVAGAGDPLFAVDHDGVRCLLVPTNGPQPVPAEASGAAVRIKSVELTLAGSRAWYLKIACLAPELYDRFTLLVSDVLDAVMATPMAPALATLQTLAQWQELMRGQSRRASREALAGLFGELTFLESVLGEVPSASVDCWQGPNGERHDFMRGAVAVEVKTTLTRTGRKAGIHGIDQLEPQTASGLLYLAWMRLEVAVGAGETVREIAERIKGKTPYRNAFDTLLASFKFDLTDDSAQVRFIVREHAMFVVDGDFPRLTTRLLTAQSVMNGVGAVSYDIDIATGAVTPLTAAETSAVVRLIAAAA